MTIGTVFTSTTTIHGLSTTIYGDLILPGITVDTINVRNSITTNQTNITNLQTVTSNMETVNGVRTTFYNDLLLGNSLNGSMNIGTTLAALRDVTANMTTVPNISTNFSGIVYLNGTLNLRTVIEDNVTDISNLQQDLGTANTTITDLQAQINHQAAHITALENQIEVLNAQFNSIRFTDGFANQIDQFDPFELLDEFLHLPDP